jgi:hypothetical protein
MPRPHGGKRGYCGSRHRIKGRRQASIGFALSRNDLGAPTRGRYRTPSLDSAPMSADRHLHDPPRPRTEVDVSGAAILAILDARIVLFTSGDDGCLSMATGVPLAAIKKGVGAEGFGSRCCVPNPPANCRRADCGSDSSNSFPALA